MATLKVLTRSGKVYVECLEYPDAQAACEAAKTLLLKGMESFWIPKGGPSHGSFHMRKKLDKALECGNIVNVGGRCRS